MRLKVGSNISSPSWSASMTLTTLRCSVIRITLTGATALSLSPGEDGQKLLLELKQGGGGSVSFDSTVAFGTDITGVTLSATTNATDYIGLVYNSTISKWRLIAFSRGY